MPKFRKKPVVIEAIQFNGNFDEIEQFVGGDAEFRNGSLVVATLEGPLHASPGDWIIRGVKGEFYPCKPDIFEATYEPAGLGQEWVSKVTTQDAPDLPVMGAMGATGVDAALPEWVRDGITTARGLTPNDRAPYHHIYIWLADALGRTLDKLECAEHERDEARLDLAAERENLASVFSATHQQMCELADDLTQAREEIEERAHSEQNLVDLQQEQHKEIVALRKSLGEAQLVIEQQDRDYRRVTAEQEPPAAPPDEPEHDPNRCIGSRWD